MSFISSSILAGLSVSASHVFSGPDHLAAVTPLVVERKNKAWKVGLFWSLGHMIGILFIGILISLFRPFIPIDTISYYSDLLIGFILILLGVFILIKLFTSRKKKPKNVITQASNYWASFSIGCIHGVAGVSHFLLILPIIALSNYSEMIKYLFGFTIGTIVSMTLYTILINMIKKRLNNSEKQFRIIRMFGALFSIIVGIYWLSLFF